MGIGGEVKTFIRDRWPGILINEKTLAKAMAADTDAQVSYPAPTTFRYPTVVCFDYTSALKMPPSEDIVNGRQYITQRFLPPIIEAFNQGATTVYVCLDRGSPMNKDAEHRRRYTNTVFMPVPEDGEEDIISDMRIPNKDQWPGFVANKQLVGDLIYYITQSLLETQAKHENTFTPPPGKMLCLHGGRSTPPNRKQFPVLLPAPEVLFVQNTLVEQQTDYGLVNLVPKRSVGRMSDYPEAHVECLQEAELACLYFAKNYPQDDVLFVTPDGDMLLQLLLMAPDRINPETGTFRNTHYLQMRLGEMSDFVNINALYLAIQNDETLKLYENPVLTFVAVSTLLKNDYIHGFCYGVKTVPSEGPLSHITTNNIPVVYQVLFSFARKYRSMFQVQPKIRTNMGNPCLVTINDDLWTQYVHDCYIVRYRKTVAKKFKRPVDTITIKDVSFVVSGYANANTHVLSDNRIRVFGRQLLWVLEYWHNNYRGECLVNPPHALYEDTSYYGWIIQSSGECLPADEVSKGQPEQTRDLNLMFKRKWEEFDTSNVEADEKGDEERAAKRFRISEVLHKSKRAYANRPHIRNSDAGKSQTIPMEIDDDD